MAAAPVDADLPLRIGILGAANISELSIVSPARITGHRLVAVAARDPRRAHDFAQRHQIERVVDTYDQLVADPEVDAVYNPLANGLHGQWNLRALAAGKHVLTEKPSAANAQEAREVRAAIHGSGLTFMEGLHYPYHPRWNRAVEILASGELGELVRVEAPMAMSDPGENDIRWHYDLAGGAVMDLGCYSLSAMWLLGEALPEQLGGHPRITSAAAVERAGHPHIDERLGVELEFPSGATGFAGADMDSPVWDFGLTITGSTASMHLDEFLRPHLDDRITVSRADGTSRVERLGSRSSYTYQLEAFADAVRSGGEPLTGADFAVTMMELIDESYRSAGLPVRRPTPIPASSTAPATTADGQSPGPGAPPR